MPGLSAFACTPAAPATLAPNATMTCTATYTVTQADVDAGSFDNTATVVRPRPERPARDRRPTRRTVTTHQAPALSLTKTATPNTGVVAGDVVTYAFTGTNTGNVDHARRDRHRPDDRPLAPRLHAGAPATLAPGDTIDCTATYTVTQADVDAGSIENTATISGLDPSNTPTSAPGATTVTADQTPALTLDKSATPSSGVVAGDVVTYSFHGQNTGTVTLHNVDVTDPMTGLSALDCTPTTPATLAPGDVIDCTADLHRDPGRRRRRHHRQHRDDQRARPERRPVSGTGGTTVTATQNASLSLTKSATPDTGVVAGDVVTYSFHGQNTGTVSVHNVDVTDPMTGLSALDCTPTTPATLAPGDAIDCTADLHRDPGRRRRRQHRQHRDPRRARPGQQPGHHDRLGDRDGRPDAGPVAHEVGEPGLGRRRRRHRALHDDREQRRLGHPALGERDRPDDGPVRRSPAPRPPRPRWHRAPRSPAAPTTR